MVQSIMKNVYVLLVFIFVTFLLNRVINGKLTADSTLSSTQELEDDGELANEVSDEIQSPLKTAKHLSYYLIYGVEHNTRGCTWFGVNWAAVPKVKEKCKQIINKEKKPEPKTSTVQVMENGNGNLSETAPPDEAKMSDSSAPIIPEKSAHNMEEKRASDSSGSVEVEVVEVEGESKQSTPPVQAPSVDVSQSTTGGGLGSTDSSPSLSSGQVSEPPLEKATPLANEALLPASGNVHPTLPEELPLVPSEVPKPHSPSAEVPPPPPAPIPQPNPVNEVSEPRKGSDISDQRANLDQSEHVTTVDPPGHNAGSGLTPGVPSVTLDSKGITSDSTQFPKLDDSQVAT